ncbi:MAG: hypothetical protein IT328_24090 [Caldilineaceae bacterium]|nr:hypothetical protein [Caldilineaceae bacterium]
MGKEDEIAGLASFMRTSKAVNDIFESISKQFANIEKALASLNIPDTIQKSLDKLSPALRDALLELGEHGWYVGADMAIPGILQLADGLKQGNPNAEIALEKYFENRIDEIEADVIGRFPLRAKIIASAFRAHRQQEYDLSIPVLLAQTDGICFDVAKGLLFRRKAGRPRTADYVDQLSGTALTNALLSPLTKNLPISATENERPPSFSHLNRHAVMHGESLNYGTKTNSLKAISLLNYVAYMLT